MSAHVPRPTNYLATRQPAPVSAGRQRKYVSNSHMLSLARAALREKVCGAERRTNTVQRRFNSRSDTRVISDYLFILDGRDSVVFAHIRARVLGVIVIDAAKDQICRDTGKPEAGARRVSKDHVFVMGFAIAASRADRRNCSILYSWASGRTGRKHVGIFPHRNNVRSGHASGEQCSKSENSDFTVHFQSPCEDAKPTQVPRHQSVSRLTRRAA